MSSDNSEKRGTVPCVSIATLQKCPHPNEECGYSHKEICFYSSSCTKNDDTEHMERFYHPKGKCRNYIDCKRPDDNHFLSYSHKCFIQLCMKPTIASLNGWVCGYHYKRLTSRHQMNHFANRSTPPPHTLTQSQPASSSSWASIVSSRQKEQ